MTINEARAEINLRLERETRYVIAMSPLPFQIVLSSAGRSVSESPERLFLKEKLADNEKTLKLLGQYIEILETTGIGENIPVWEKFYREHYWEKK